jgi:hypothetical protein
MHVRDLVELAALVVAHGPVRIGSGRAYSEEGLSTYWQAARCRLDRWARAIKTYSSAPSTPAVLSPPPQWEAIQPVVEEILASEMLTRVWTALGCGLDEAGCGADVSSVLENIWVGHQEARYRALRLLLSGQGLRVEQAVALNRLRRICERWTDMLLSQLVETCPTNRFAFQPRRVREYAADLRGSHDPQLDWSVLRASLRASFQRSLRSVPANADLNRQLAAGILACLEGDSFDATGLPKSLWMTRMERIASDTQGLVEDLLSAEEPAPFARRTQLFRGRRP